MSFVRSVRVRWGQCVQNFPVMVAKALHVQRVQRPSNPIPTGLNYDFPRSYPIQLYLRLRIYAATCTNGLLGFDNAEATVCCDVYCDQCGGPGCGSPTTTSVSADDCTSSNILENDQLWTDSSITPLKTSVFL